MLTFSLKEGTRRTSAGQLLAQPGSVVRGEHDQRVVIDPQLVESLQDLTCRPVNLLDRIPIQPPAAAPFEILAGVQTGTWGMVCARYRKKGRFPACRLMKARDSSV